ncbi:hypothetical protein GTQ43_08055 [Nostoc sp. KVJ3]|uniref:hypothetical protein n=1 Tax=Nostoc sp. KVJ3 TaxID=457945 RepID=UPI002238D697|nr:hypothetical protein [Nostoc sp. KVJ3]MCW5313759.1 hypothetical protein [Nostoc sp. KVJ3]
MLYSDRSGFWLLLAMTFTGFRLFTLRVVTLSLLVVSTSCLLSRAAQQPLESFAETNIKLVSNQAISSSVEKQPNHNEKSHTNALAIAVKHILKTLR